MYGHPSAQKYIDVKFRVVSGPFHIILIAHHGRSLGKVDFTMHMKGYVSPHTSSMCYSPVGWWRLRYESGIV